jgi:hypothetical protein
LLQGEAQESPLIAYGTKVILTDPGYEEKRLRGFRAVNSLPASASVEGT